MEQLRKKADEVLEKAWKHEGEDEVLDKLYDDWKALSQPYTDEIKELETNLLVERYKEVTERVNYINRIGIVLIGYFSK